MLCKAVDTTLYVNTVGVANTVCCAPNVQNVSSAFMATFVFI